MNRQLPEAIDLRTPEGRAAWQEIAQRAFGRPSKYGNVATQTDVGLADSKAEAERWAELRLLEQAGAISELRFHPRYDLPAGIVYEADAAYVQDGRHIAEDVKGRTAPLTQVFKLKARLFRETYFDIELRIERR